MLIARILRISTLALAGAVLAAGTASAQHAQHAQSPSGPRVTGSAKLRAEAKVDEATALATAQKEVPTGKIQSGELEREKGKLIYSFDIKVAGKSGIDEVNVDAMSGAIVAHEHESPAAERKETAQEAREKKHTKKP